MFTILLIMKIYLIANNSPIIIPFNNNLNKTYKDLREFMSLVQWNFFQVDIYVGRPVQKIKNIALLRKSDSANIYDYEKISIKYSKDENGYDVCKSKTANNYTYVADANDDMFIEYGIANDSIYFGNRNYKEAKQFINFIQLNQSQIYFPLNGYISINSNTMFQIFEYFDSKKGVIIESDEYPHKYDLRYKEKDLESLIFNNVKFGDINAYSINKLKCSLGNVIKLNNAYSFYFNLYSCSKIYFDNNNNYYYKCSENFDTSLIKISIGNLVFDENDLVWKF